MSGENTEAAPSTNEYLGGRPFKFQIYFWNNDGRMIKLRGGAVKELVIEDSILRWYHHGHLIFQNTQDAFERVEKKFMGEEPVDVSPYRFRNDGRDYMIIELDVPIENDIMSAESLDNEVFTIKLMLSITETEDINSEGNKFKKVSFWDYRQQQMFERNLFWNSPSALKRQSNSGMFKSPYLLTEQQTSIYTGLAIKDIITECLKTPTTTPEFEEDFSKGGEKIFYNSPTNARAYEDMMYVLARHTHDTKTAEPCILRCNRYTDKWSLLPITEYFNRVYIPEAKGPGPLTRDKFFIADQSRPMSVSTNQSRTADKSTALNNFWNDHNLINAFEFFESSSLDAQDNFNTAVVEMHDSRTKQFDSRFELGDIESTREYMRETMFKNLLGGEGGVYPSFVLNKNRKENKTYRTTFSPVSNKCREALEGRNRTIMSMIMQGNGIKFNVPGMPSRQAGVFIAVERDGGFNDNEYDDKILGNYLTVSVKHIINKSGYANEVYSVKPYKWQKPEYNEDVQ